ncbi:MULTISPECIES: hypothetical protein [Cytobacillus]|uniref:Uncharacterized protein n=1 Tax=Cytobacillus oceanisediminis 2691 TaxID=1196031 RepID=A0A161J1X2_9BACI|nr:hypothetical protein [Cytobacillus oceanisediminis]AND39535.1 hypothetical protein A361_10450 [Cytobacillus oceanisediminis 2691]
MAETVKVKPTPIQRNKFDVAMELTNLHLRNYGIPEEEVEGVFAKYYALAAYCESSDVYTIKNLIDADLLSKMSR